ncbi:hypothetical protein DXG01_009899 [Tephrocybe rancida]|nr:hypothetical protein DXG01_009899 [Tephrocybe rancida]
MHSIILIISALVTFTFVAKGSPTAQTVAQFNEWFATIPDEDITFIGKPIDKTRGVTLGTLAALDTFVMYCSTRSGSICTTPCTVYNGPATCISAPNTNCLFATNDVAFCDGTNCNGSCNDYNSCGTRLDQGFCYTPGTRSIAVSTA